MHLNLVAGDHENGTGNPSSGWPVLDYPLGGACVLLLCGLAGLTCTDVVARYWFNAPVNGAFELTQLMLAALIFAALPMTTAAGQHIDVELLSLALGKTINKLFTALAHLVSALVLFGISWRIWIHAERLAGDGAVTNSLGLPFAPVGYFAALSCFLSALIALFQLIRVIRPSGGGAARG